MLILVAAEPDFSESQLARALIAAEAERITPLIALNKSDLVEPFERAWARLLPYQRMHYGVLPLSLRLSSEIDREHLLKHLHGQDHAGAGPVGRGQEHADQPAGAGRAGADRRDLAGAPFGQAHHHQHHLVLGGSASAPRR